jgi:hypothetical protein
MKNIINIAIIACMCILLNACKNDAITPDPTDDDYNPTITFIEPEEGEVYNSGDSLHMEFSIENPGEEIHHVGVWAINETAGDTIYDYFEHADIAEYYEFHEHTLLTVSTPSTFKVVAWTSNHDETDTIFAERHVIVNP